MDFQVGVTVYHFSCIVSVCYMLPYCIAVGAALRRRSGGASLGRVLARSGHDMLVGMIYWAVLLSKGASHEAPVVKGATWVSAWGPPPLYSLCCSQPARFTPPIPSMIAVSDRRRA
jgi:hypothetical protein